MKLLLSIGAVCLIGGGVIWVRSATTPGELATITAITDGDTVRLATRQGREIRVRLACIDAPESTAKHGDSATRRLEELTPAGSRVRFKDLGSGGFGRRAGELYSGIWPLYTNANRVLVAEGKAVVYPQYVSKCDRVAYWWDEKWARMLRRGVQGDSTFCKPWVYRNGICPARKTQGFLYWLQSVWMNPWAM